MRLSTRIVITMLILASLTAGTVGLLSYHLLQRALVPSELSRLELHTRQVAQSMEADVRGVSNSVLALSFTPSVAGFVRARASGGTDPDTGIDDAEWRRRVSSIFLAHVNAYPNYSRLRIIGAADDGRELVRVERNHQTGEVREVPETELQTKGERPFFIEALGQRPNTVHLSRIELNQDFGAILEPHMPTIWASTVLLAPDGSTFGIIIINIDLRETLAQIRQSTLPLAQLMVVDTEGNYLLHPDPSKEFGFDLDKPSRIGDEWPGLVPEAWSNAGFSGIQDASNGESHAVAVDSFMLAGILPLHIVEALPVSVLMSPAIAVRNSTLLTILGASLLAVIAAIFLARSLTRPLEQIAQRVTRNLDAHGGNSLSEVAALGKAFEQLQNDVLKKTQALAAKTEEQSELSAALEESIRSALRFSAAVESSGDAIITTDTDGIINGWNHAAEQFFGTKKHDAIGNGLGSVLQFSDTARLNQALSEIRQGGRADHWETSVSCGQSSPCSVSLTLSPVSLPAGDLLGFSLIVQDDTAHRTMEAQLRQAQKMEAIGQLAGGVAHDFNNLLTVIIGCTELLFDMTKGNDSTGELLNEVHQAGMRAAGLTRQLLAFSRRSIVSVSLVHVNELLREMDQMLRRLIGEDVEITMLLSSGLPPVKADPSQIEQLVLNLAVNSRDAMPTGGKIIIESHHAVLDEKYADAHIEVDPGEYVVISVSDNGCGMDEATRLRIFDPFFTTKEQGRGTGLGLSTVYGIVKQSGGHISCYSEVGHGTTFKIYLPVVIDTNGMRNLRPDTMPVSLKGNESILLVEDEDGVRALAKRVLEQAGYQVIEARDGKEVSEKLASLAGPLQLVVTDVVLPTLSGREIAEMVKVMYPKVRVLYASGYTDDAVVRYGVLRSEMPFIHKPFTPQALLRKVREVLDAPTDRPTGQDV